MYELQNNTRITNKFKISKNRHYDSYSRVEKSILMRIMNFCDVVMGERESETKYYEYAMKLDGARNKTKPKKERKNINLAN